MGGEVHEELNRLLEERNFDSSSVRESGVFDITLDLLSQMALAVFVAGGRPSCLKDDAIVKEGAESAFATFYQYSLI